MADTQNTGNGNNWRAGTSEKIGALTAEVAALRQLMADPHTGLGALHKSVGDVRHEISRMKATQFALGGLLVAAGAIIGGAMPQIGQRILSLTVRLGEVLGAG